MRPVLIDTNAYVSYKQGNPLVAEVIKYAETLAMSPVVLGELMSGFECGNRIKKKRDELQQFLASPRIKVFSISADTANFYRKIYFSLRNKGKPIPTNDLWIAAQMLENGCVLCSYDKHFKEIDSIVSGVTLSELIL